MKKILKSKTILIFLSILTVIILVLFINYASYLKKAHSSFENYYSFRGCTMLISKNHDDGTCKLADGQTIKIVKFENKWYLDGDLPYFQCLGKLCIEMP